MSVRERLSALGIEIPPPAEPKGAYFPSRLVGDQLWISGTTSRRPTEPGAFGTVGEDVTPEQAQKHAGYAALNLIAAVDAAVGLEAVRGLVHLRGYVRASPHFDSHPAVIDGASKLLMDVFGEQRGAHARTAVGVASLPGGACVELELVASVRP
ncbi:RidA family protein [Mycolicibacterium smegmatis]|uniref:Translation initiation inhibitor n=1 Tax=Mycolicibacterium smegmatis (strain MKD8) TaxID=1214915 RepID=A0A2U9PNU4_MYCSE|nr:RidA family protein [Mycolicibacterium smegmatis]AWT53404.1 translation initiation inhibitor [Mycolicibacterium smegmatis MKD8]